MRSSTAAEKSENGEEPKDERKLKRTLTNESHHSPQRVGSHIATTPYRVYSAIGVHV